MEIETVNIPILATNPYYPYKRPKVRILRASKNITIITNFQIIANILEVDPDDLYRFFSKYLKTPSRISNHDCILNGIYSVEEIEKCLEIFIEKYVLCVNCGIPEVRNDLCYGCGYVNRKFFEYANTYQVSVVPVDPVSEFDF